MPPGLGRCPAQETSIARSGEGGKVLKNPAPTGGKVLKNLSPAGGKVLKKSSRKGPYVLRTDRFRGEIDVRGVRRASANGGERRLLLVRNQQVGGSSPLAGSMFPNKTAIFRVIFATSVIYKCSQSTTFGEVWLRFCAFRGFSRLRIMAASRHRHQVRGQDIDDLHGDQMPTRSPHSKRPQAGGRHLDFIQELPSREA
jgi:hypothetical protein